MCDICHYNQQSPHCPNAHEPPIVHNCYCCDDGIRDGEDYYDIDGIGYVHIDCVNDITVDEWLNSTGSGYVHTAEIPYYQD